MKILNLLNRPLGSTPYGGYDVVKKEWLPIAMAGASLLSSTIGGIASSNANKEALEEARGQKIKEDLLLQRRRNENYLDTAAGQAMMARAREFNRENLKRAAGARAVGGGTEASEAMTKEAGNKMMGETLSQIAAKDAERKDGVDAEQLASDRAYSQQVQAYQQQRGQAIAQAAQGASNALMMGAMATASASKPNISGGNNGGTPTGTETPALTTNQSPLYNNTAFWGKKYELTKPQFRTGMFG